MAQSSDASLYALLEVSASASREEIDASYQRIVGYLGPDSMAMYSMLEDNEADRLRVQVDEAYRTLADPNRRAAYDRACGLPESAYVHHASPHSASPPLVESPRDAASARELTLAANAAARAIFMEAAASDVAADDLPPPSASRAEPVATAPAAVVAVAAVAAVAEIESEAVVVAPTPVSRTAAPARRGGSRRRLQATIVVTPDTEFSGQLLRRLRESCNASLDDIAELTKISKRYLQALEENDVDSLPAVVYVRGFVSQYARALGLDSKLVSHSYMVLYERSRGGNG